MQSRHDSSEGPGPAAAPRGLRAAPIVLRARRLAVLAAAAVFLLGAEAWALQGGAKGPFEAARLSDEPLTDDPGGAFEMLLLSAGVALLAATATCAFLALARLGALERALQREGARRREEAEALRAEVAALAEAAREASSRDGDGASGEDAALRLSGEIAGLEAAIDRVRVAVERAAAPPADSDRTPDPGPDLARLGEDLRALAEAARDSGETASRRAAEALRGGLADLRDALRSNEGGAPAERAGPAGVVERIQTRLLAMGYTDPVVVSTGDEISSAVESGGALVVEARRAGSVHKGRVVIDGGAIAGVELRPSHDIFP